MNEFDGKRVLILEGYARQSLPFMRAFKKLGCYVSVLCHSKLDLAYWSRYADEKIMGICEPEAFDESSDYVCNLIRSGRFDLVLPLVDFSAQILAEHKQELSQYAKIVVNDWNVFRVAQDKLEVMRICEANDIPCPKTLIEIDEFDENVFSTLNFPIVVKPRKGCGSQGFKRFDAKFDAIKYLKDKRVREYVIQEYVEQTCENLSVNLFIDNSGVVKSSFVYASRRWFPLKGGTGTFNELVDRPEAIESCERLAKILNLRGCVGFDLIVDPQDQIARIIEVNPRSLACSRIGFEAGVNLAEMTLQKEFGQEVAPRTLNKKNVSLRMFQTDFLWFVISPNRFKANPSFFQIRNVKDQIWYWDDPVPWFAFSLRGMVRLRKELKKRK